MNLAKRYFSGYHQPGGIKELLVLAFPMIISTACDGVMTFTDRLFLAKTGPEQMNAAMGGGVAMQMMMFFFLGLTGYSTALVAQYLGAGEKHNSSKAAFQAILITIAAWPVILLLKPLAVEYFQIMHIPETQAAFQVKYLNILAWGSVFSMMRYTLGCYFTGIGKTKIVMTATVTAMAVNVALDYVLVFGKFGFPAMGIEGAALATITGSFCAVVVLAIKYFRPSNLHEFSILTSFRFNRAIMKKLIHYGYPAGLEMFLNFLAFSTMIALFHAQGESVATASTIMFNWDLVSFIPLLGIEVAVTSLVGRYMGAGKPELAQRAAISAIKSGIFYSVVVLAMFVLVPGWLVRVFRPETADLVFEEAVPMAIAMVKIAAIYVLAEAVFVAVVGALRGAGDTFFTMITSVTAHWLFVPLLYLAFNVFHQPAEIGWLMLVMFFMIFCTIMILRFRSGKWKKIRVIH